MPITTDVLESSNTSDSYSPREKPYASRFPGHWHPKSQQALAEANAYYLEHWPFKSEDDKRKFMAADYNRYAVQGYPKALDDRILLACLFITWINVIDDDVETMKVEDGRAFYNSLLSAMKSEEEPPRKTPHWVGYDLFKKMHAKEAELADVVFEMTKRCLDAQTQGERLQVRGLSACVAYRKNDIGAPLNVSVYQWAMDLRVSPAELKSIDDLMVTYTQLGFALNDIYSFDRERAKYLKDKFECAYPVNLVQGLYDEDFGLDIGAAKRIAWVIVAEWELQFERQRQARLAGEPCSAELKSFMEVMETSHSGYVIWVGQTSRNIDF